MTCLDEIGMQKRASQGNVYVYLRALLCLLLNTLSLLSNSVLTTMELYKDKLCPQEIFDFLLQCLQTNLHIQVTFHHRLLQHYCLYSHILSNLLLMLPYDSCSVTIACYFWSEVN